MTTPGDPQLARTEGVRLETQGGLLGYYHRLDADLALPVKGTCECRWGEGARTDMQCPDHGIRASAARELTDDELDQLRQDMGYDTYER